MANQAPILESCVQLPIEEKVLNEIVEKAKDYALMHGVGIRSKTAFNSDVLQFAPFVLTPSSFPRREFEKAINMQPILNELMHSVAHDSEFLRSVLEGTIKVDEFTANLFKIYETVLQEKPMQPISLGLLRSDLMLETKCVQENQCKTNKSGIYCCWKQVEFNTIASGFGHLGPSSKFLQSFIVRELGHAEKLKNMPENNALSGLCDAMVEAWKLLNSPESAIMFIIEDITYNICDQRFHEFYLRETYPHIKVIRRTLTQVYENGKLAEDHRLIVDDFEVSVIYFRAGYEPNHYHSQNEWDARLMMERSIAIKCPSIHYHLAGTKKVQQALDKPGILNRFISDESKIEAIKQIFTGLYSLDQKEGGDEAVKMALKEPERFVLKPQREGGGNNVYGADIVEVLEKMTIDERSAWILMERIIPPLSMGYLIRPGLTSTPQLSELVSELGIFGAIIGSKNNVVYNKQVGHMLRTKLSTSNEGGVAAGSGALDSPYLIDD